jgi:hypothetical protein
MNSMMVCCFEREEERGEERKRARYCFKKGGD